MRSENLRKGNFMQGLFETGVSNKLTFSLKPFHFRNFFQITPIFVFSKQTKNKMISLLCQSGMCAASVRGIVGESSAVA
jgi:hypothetical protein